MNGKSYNINGKLGMNGVRKPSWNGQLYDAGNEFVWKTGGWSAYAYKPTSVGSTATAPTLVKNTTNMVSTLIRSGTDLVGSIFMNNAIDLTNYTKLKITYSATQPSAQYTIMGILATPTKSNSYTVSGSAILINKYTTSASGTVEFDVSTLNGSYYVATEQEITVNGTSSLTITKIWLE